MQAAIRNDFTLAIDAFGKEAYVITVSDNCDWLGNCSECSVRGLSFYLGRII